MNFLGELCRIEGLKGRGAAIQQLIKQHLKRIDVEHKKLESFQRGTNNWIEILEKLIHFLDRSIPDAKRIEEGMELPKVLNNAIKDFKKFLENSKLKELESVSRRL